jgi:anaerobic selenocysteine-containing dehydrogenase
MEERIAGYCALCVSRCGCTSVVEDGVLRSVEPLPMHPTGKSLCIKGKAAPEIVHSPDRILTPLRRSTPKGSADPAWEPVSWDEALDAITARLQEIVRDDGPEAVAFGVTTPSGTGISDSFAWIHRLAHAFGSPNTLFATENCNWHKDFAPTHTFGNSIGMPDFAKTGCILLWGANPASTWLSQAEEIVRALNRGAKLIVVDPRKAGLAVRADEWLRVRPAADGPLAMALAHQLIESGWFDEQFVRDWTNGPLLVREDTGELVNASDLDPTQAQHRYLAVDTAGNELCAYDPATGNYQEGHGQLALTGRIDLMIGGSTVTCRPAFEIYAQACAEFTPEHTASITDVPAQQIKDTARLLHESGPVSYFTWTGTVQQSQATQTGRAIALLYALLGHIDAPGGNVFFTKPPITNMFGLELLTAEARAKTLGAGERPIGPGTMGWITSLDLNRSIVDGNPYRVNALVAFGGNPLLTKPDSDGARAALEQLDFYVHADMFHNPASSYADIVLPVASPWERSGLAAGFQVSQLAESWIQLRPAVIPPLGDSRSDTWIVFELAKRLGLGEHFFGGDMDAALQQVLEPTGVTLNDLQSRPEGMALPLVTHYLKYREHGFATPTKKLEIYSETFQDCGYAPVPRFAEEQPHDIRYPLRLTSAKWIAYCHSQYRQIPMLRKRVPDPLVEIHPQAAATRGIKAHDWVVIETSKGSIRAKAKLNKSLAIDVVCSQYGWWGDSHGNYNNLISDTDFDPISSSNTLRNCACNVFRDH